MKAAHYIDLSVLFGINTHSRRMPKSPAVLNGQCAEILTGYQKQVGQVIKSLYCGCVTTGSLFFLCYYFPSIYWL